jgi:3-dehydroquinate synthase
MIHASRLAERRGLIDTSVTARQISLLQALHLPTALPTGLTFPTEEVLARMRLDKKSVSGSLRFVLPTRLGEVKTFSNVPESDVVAVLG